MGQNCIRIQADKEQIERCKNKLGEVEQELTQLSVIVGLVGNDTRLKILYLLQEERSLCVCDLSDILTMTVPAISQQLRKLKDGGVITSQRDGTLINYSLNEKYKKVVNGILNNNSVFEILVA